jgi:ribosomal protein S18
MQNYELVLMLDYQVQDSDRKDLLSKFEKDFKDSIIKKDDMWLQELQHDLKWKRGNNRAYLVSFYIQANDDTLNEIRKWFLYSNVLVRYEIFKMSKEQTFLEFDKLQKELTDIMDARDSKRFWNRISFLSHAENAKYINWKAIIILKKYMTRFWSIKPRKYTKNPVKTQKKLRKEIIRARGLWLLEFIRN